MSLLGRLRRTSPSSEKIMTQQSLLTWEQGQMRACVIELSNGGAELLGVAAVPIEGAHPERPDVDRWVVACDKALTQAEDLTLTTRSRKLVPDYVVMSLPDQFTRSLSVVVSKDRHDLAYGVTFEEVRTLLQRGYRKAQDSLGTNAQGATEEIICGSLAEIALGDHVVDDPLGLNTTRLEFRMCFWLAPVEWVRAFEVIAERLQLGLTAIVPQQVACASPLLDPAALLMLMGERHTSVGLVRRGRPQWGAVIETGERNLTEATALSFDLKGRQADALMRAFRASELREDVESQLAASFWNELRDWMTRVAKGVKQVANGTDIPHRVYFADLTHRVPEAAKSLETPFWEQSLPFERCPEITQLGVGNVRDVLDCTSQAGGPSFLLLRSLAHYVARLYVPGSNWDRALSEMIRSHDSQAS